MLAVIDGFNADMAGANACDITHAKESLPLSFQFYYVDVRSGAFHVFGDAQCELKSEGDDVSFKANATDAKVSFDVKNSTPVNTRKIRGKKLYADYALQNIDYSSFACEGTARIGNKKYRAFGASEITGREPSLWI